MDSLVKRLADLEASASDPSPSDRDLVELKVQLESLVPHVTAPVPLDHAENSACRQAVKAAMAFGHVAPFTEGDSRTEAPQTEESRYEFSSAGQHDEILGEIRDYKLLAKLGEGGMGAVYKALHTRLNKVVALKVLPADKMRDATALARFEREMQAVGRLQHPNIVAAHDAGEAEGRHFLVMELVDGEDLSQIVKRHGPLGVADACEVVRQAAVGLQEAHEHGMVHRDIKPSNLMLAVRRRKKKTTATVKILDMGLALLDERHAGGGELTSTGQLMGTIDYMAPEQAADTHNVDIRADIYALGATLYKLLTGVAPLADDKYDSAFKKIIALVNEQPPSVGQRRPDLPAELIALVDAMMAKRPDSRPATPENVAEALARFCTGHSLAALLDRDPGDAGGGDGGGTVSLSAPSAETSPTFLRRHEQTPQERTIDVSVAKPASAPASRRNPSRRLLLIANASGAALVLAAALSAIVLLIQTPEGGTVRIEILDPDIEVSIKGGEVLLRGVGKKDITFTPGKDVLHVKRGNFKFDITTLELKKNQTTVVRVEWLAEGTLKASHDGKVIGSDSESIADSSNSLSAPPAAISLSEMLASGEWEWAEPENLGPVVNSPYRDASPRLDATGRTLIFESTRAGGFGADRTGPFVRRDLWMTTRDSLQDDWKAPINLPAPVNSQWIEDRHSISADGLTLLFCSSDRPRPGGPGYCDIWISTRTSPNAKWSEPVPFQYNTEHLEGDPFLSADGLTLYFYDGLSIKKCTRDDVDGPWRSPVPLPDTINSQEFAEAAPWISEDGLVFMFHRADDKGNVDMWVTTRRSTNEEWSESVPLSLISSPAECPSYCRADGFLYFSTSHPGGSGASDLWRSKLVRKSSTTTAWRPSAEQQAFFDAVDRLPPEEQVEAVRKKLQEVNPGFDGKVEHKIVRGRVFLFWFLTDEVSDIWPVGALRDLKQLRCEGSDAGKGRLADLGPLSGISLEVLYFQHNQVSDLGPLKGMPLSSLVCGDTRVSDLSPIEGAPLVKLEMSDTRVSDLSPLASSRLTYLNCGRTPVRDLSPLANLQLRELHCGDQISDLSPLKGMPLVGLSCGGLVTDLSPLAESPLTHLVCTTARVRNLSPIAQLPLTHFNCSRTMVPDLSPLKGMQLETLHVQLSLYNSADEVVVRSLPLNWIGPSHGTKQPPEQFWKEIEARRERAEQFADETAKLPVREQIDAVNARIQQLSEGQAGRLECVVNDGDAVEATLDMAEYKGWDDMPDVTPLMALKKLKKLTLIGGPFWLDISCVSRLPLEELTVSDDIALKNSVTLREMASLNAINGQLAAEFLSELGP